MKKKSVWMFSLAALLMIAVSSQDSSLSLYAPSAFADEDASKDKDDSKNKGDSKDQDDTKDKDDQVTICHTPAGNPSKAQTLNVSESALSAHLAHGDSPGECGCICPPGVYPCGACTDGKDGMGTSGSITPSASQRELYGQ